MLRHSTGYVLAARPLLDHKHGEVHRNVAEAIQGLVALGGFGPRTNVQKFNLETVRLLWVGQRENLCNDENQPKTSAHRPLSELRISEAPDSGSRA
jgi:hypothetical protein